MKKIVPFILSMALTLSFANAFAASADWQEPTEEFENEQIQHNDKTGEPLTGWQDINGKKYYFNDDGKMAVDKVMIDSKQYTFDSNGVWNGKPGIIITEFDDMSLKWGDSSAAVKKAKGNKNVSYCNYNNTSEFNSYYLEEAQKIGDCYYYTEYSFNKNDALAYGQYLLLSDLSSDECVVEYKNIFASNVEKYGKPTRNVIRWKSTEYKNKYGNDIATAIKDGYCTKFACWETSTSKIYVKIAGIEGKIQVRMLYYDITQEDLFKTAMTITGDCFWNSL